MSPADISFFVPGIPATAGSKRAFVPKGWTRAIITDMSGKRGKDWRGDVKRFALEAHNGPPLTGPLCVHFAFWLPYTKAHYRTGRKSTLLRDDAPWWHEKRPDVLKMARAVEDALTGIIWVDDSQIAYEVLIKRYSVGTTGCAVRVERLTFRSGTFLDALKQTEISRIPEAMPVNQAKQGCHSVS